MSRKRYKAEQIVTLLRQIEVGIANGAFGVPICADDRHLTPKNGHA